MNERLSIKEVKLRTGISDHALRYYEKCGLLQGIARLPGGRRQYTEQDLEWINTVKLLRSTGMPIRQIAHLARLRRAGAATIEARIAYFETYQAELEQQIAMRKEAIKAISNKIARHQVMLRERDKKE